MLETVMPDINSLRHHDHTLAMGKESYSLREHVEEEN